MSSKQRQLRKKRALSDDEGDAGEELQQSNLEDIKMLQKQRRKVIGIDDKTLALGDGQDGGGYHSAQEADTKLMETYVKATTAAVADESVHMQRFIEKEVGRRLGRPAGDPLEALTEGERVKLQQEQELYAVPDPLKATLQQEVVLPGLITGLTEVPLTVEQKLKNIEQTECIKSRLLASQKAGARFDDEQPQQELPAKRSMFVFEFGKCSNKGKDKGEEPKEHRKVIRDPAVKQYGARPAAASGCSTKK